MRSHTCNCSEDPVALKILRERLDDDLQKSKYLSDENIKLRSYNKRLIEYLRNLALLESESQLEGLMSEIDTLRLENDHLRQLLNLGTYSFNNEFSAEADNSNRSSLSEHSSFYLMTPPRSPAHLPPNGKVAARRTNTGRVGSSSPHPVTTASVSLQETQLDKLLPDIADVGPPMSPPPDTSRPAGTRRVASVDPSDSADAHEAEMGTQEVDHDLSSSH